jgi:hypothetical protein
MWRVQRLSVDSAGGDRNSAHSSRNQLLSLAILHLEYMSEKFYVLLDLDNIGDALQNSFLELVDARPLSNVCVGAELFD